MNVIEWMELTGENTPDFGECVEFSGAHGTWSDVWDPAKHFAIAKLWRPFLPPGATHIQKNPKTGKISFWCRGFDYYSWNLCEAVDAWFWWNGKSWQKEYPQRWAPEPL